jgi:hypothetical protein
MAVMNENWTDGRLDELSTRMTEGFARMDQEFARVDKRFERIDQRFERVDEKFQGMEREANKRHDALLGELMARSDAVQRSIVTAVIGMTGAFMAGFAAILVLIATQL